MLTSLCDKLNVFLNNLLNYSEPKGRYLCEKKNTGEGADSTPVLLYLCFLIAYIFEIIRKSSYWITYLNHLFVILVANSLVEVVELESNSCFVVEFL